MKAMEKAKTYKITYNVGKVKYLLSFYTGERLHPDGSMAEDIRTFHNKKELAKAEKQLLAEGYSYATV